MSYEKISPSNPARITIFQNARTTRAAETLEFSSMEELAEFFETVVRPRTKCTDADRVVFIGDAMDDTTLEMSIATLLEYRSILFSYPQHHFVFPPDGAWCFSYSFEDDMFFAFAPR